MTGGINCISKNLLPLTIGNIIGWAGVVGLTDWVIYLREKKIQYQDLNKMRD